MFGPPTSGITSLDSEIRCKRKSEWSPVKFIYSFTHVSQLENWFLTSYDSDHTIREVKQVTYFYGLNFSAAKTS